MRDVRIEVVEPEEEGPVGDGIVHEDPQAAARAQVGVEAQLRQAATSDVAQIDGGLKRAAPFGVVDIFGDVSPLILQKPLHRIPKGRV